MLMFVPSKVTTTSPSVAITKTMLSSASLVTPPGTTSTAANPQFFSHVPSVTFSLQVSPADNPSNVCV